MNKPCEHLQQFVAENKKTAKTYECEECITTGDKWVHLRTCQTCGITLCCDSSPNRHASKHATRQRHPVAMSSEPNERWAWCYHHLSFLKY
jgi:hypothetical protein